MPIYRIADKNILFIHVPKAAGTSVEAWLNTYGDESFRTKRRRDEFPCVPQHWHAEILSELFRPDFFDFAFCVVRNPFKRLQSEYRYRITRPRLKNRVLPSPGFPGWVRRSLSSYRANPYLFSNHLRPQAEFPTEGAEVFRIEDQLPQLRDRLQQVCGIEMAGDFPQKNVTRDGAPAVYDAATAGLAQAFYADDFARFGYDRDGWQGQD